MHTRVDLNLEKGFNFHTSRSLTLEVTALARSRILSQASTALLAQTNVQSKRALSLLG